MVLDQFVTTYRKDYLWPYIRSFGNKPLADNIFQPQYRSDQGDHGDLCPCHCLEQPVTPSMMDRPLFGPNIYEQQGWSRLGPMGPLLDPKLYPAKVGRSPESDTMRFNQPNVFLHKLQEKYPYLYEVLRTSPPDDLIARINRDRLRTTYQVDYCHMNEYPSLPYDELIRAAGVGGQPPCPEPVRLPGDPCRPNQRPVAFRPATISKMGAGKGIPGARGGSGGSGGGGGSGGKGSSGGFGSGDGGKGGGENNENCGCGCGITAWNPFIDNGIEVSSNIKTWGNMIYRDVLHAHGKNSPGRLRRGI